MKVDYEKEELVFEDGHRENANCLIVGLCLEEDDMFRLYAGYDNMIGKPRHMGGFDNAMELAEYMIGAWTKYRDKLEEEDKDAIGR